MNLSPGDRASADLMFTVNTTAALGDTLKADIRCVANSDVSVDSTFDVIRGSFDPNDKSATPVMNLVEVTAGKYINYLVRFQNTGTDTAVNVVITDVLDGLLDANSFQVLDASHPCITKRTGSNLTFEFIGIMLPDSNVNEAASHGYVRFRVKPLASVLPNTIITNLAQIYFDFNSPIVTNTATTSISVDVVPLTLLEFAATADQQRKEARLQWKTASEINTLLFEIEKSADGRNFSKAGATPARGFGDHSYEYRAAMTSSIEFYRLKIIDMDGRHNYSETRRVELKGSESFSIWNLPGSQQLLLDVHSIAQSNQQAVIVDSKGSVISKVEVSLGKQFVSLTALPAGLYYLKLGSQSKRFVVVR